jgi:hypothetical protein
MNYEIRFFLIRLMHDDTKLIKQRFYESHLPRIKPVVEHGIATKQLSPRQPKRRSSTFFPPITRNVQFGSTVSNGPLASPTPNTESSSSTITYNSAVHDAAQRFILRNNMAKFSPELSSVNVSNLFQRRKTIYDHIPAKIDTGLPRTDSLHPPESDTHQLEPIRRVNWSKLKHELEQDIPIRAHAKRIQFNSNITYATQLTTLGNILRLKVKSHLSSPTGSGDERYKIVVHLTVFPATAAGLHVASRCLWDTRTDNSITIKMQGVDCNILIVVFLCYTELGAL